MERNLDLMIRVRDWARAHPEEHDQNSWIFRNCKTTFCIGGAAAEFAGGRWLTHNPRFMDEAGWYLVPEPDDDPDAIFKVRVGDLTRRGVDAQHRAQQVLGLTEEESDTLFLDFDKVSALSYLDELIRKETERRRSAARRAAT